MLISGLLCVHLVELNADSYDLYTREMGSLESGGSAKVEGSSSIISELGCTRERLGHCKGGGWREGLATVNCLGGREEEAVRCGEVGVERSPVVWVRSQTGSCPAHPSGNCL